MRNFRTGVLLRLAFILGASAVKSVSSQQLPTFSNYESLKDQVESLQSLPNPTEEQQSLIKKFNKADALNYARMLTPNSNDATLRKYFEAMKEAGDNISSYRTETGVHFWEQVGPFIDSGCNMGRIDAVATPNGSEFMQTIYAGAPNSGIWKTIDGGLNWSNISDGYFNIGAGCQEIAIDPNNSNNIYASIGINSSVPNIHDDGETYGLGVYKSTDAGLTWSPTALSFDIIEGTNIWRIIINPDNSQQQYAISSYQVFRTLDGWNTAEVIFGNQIVSATDDTVDLLHPDIDNDGQPDEDALNQSMKWKSKWLVDIEADPNNWNNVFISSIGQNAYDGASESTYHSAEFWFTTNGQAINVGDVDWTFDRSFYPFELTDDAAQSTEVILLDFVEGINYGLFAVTSSWGGEGNISIFKRNFVTNSWEVVRSGLTKNVAGLNFEFSVSPSQSDAFYLCSIYPEKILPGFQSFSSLPNGHLDTRDLVVFSEDLGDGVLRDVLLSGNDGGVFRVNRVIGGAETSVYMNNNGLSVTQFYGLDVYNKDYNFLFSGAQDGNHYKMFQSDNLQHTIGISADRYDFLIDRSQKQRGFGSYQDYVSKYLNHASSAPSVIIPGWAFPWNPPVDRNWQSSNIAFFGGDNLLKISFPSQLNNNHEFEILEIPASLDRKLQTIRVCKSDADIIYVAVDSRTDPGSGGGPLQVNKLFITRDGGDSWTDLTPVLNNYGDGATRWFGINRIEIDPIDPSVIYLGLNGIVQTQYPTSQRIIVVDLDFDQVDLTVGATVELEYLGLPRLPINELKFAPGLSRKLYAATDIGLFMRDYDNTELNEWIPVSDNLPVCMVTDMEFDIYTNEIYISTFGRGIWKSSMPCEPSSSEIHITSDITLNHEMFIQSNLIVESGATLTVKSVVVMPSNTSITVMQGGKLIIDGGTLTTRCGDLWEGITVLGHTNGSQMNAGMGIVELKNNAIIENARVGITVGERIYYDQDAWFWGNTGGIVYAIESSFLNNEQDVVFHPYQNFNPQTQALMRNKSYFKKCLFEVNRQVHGIDQLESRVRLNCIDGVRFIACTFGIEDEALDYYANAEDRGIGLMTVQSSYEVKGSCNEPVQAGSECSPEVVVSSNLNSPDIGIVPSRFNNFQIGIRSSANGPIPSTITTTLFDGNSYGAYLINMQNAKIERNQFDIKTTSDHIQHGLHMEGCSGYKVERNSFKGDERALDSQFVGAFITNSGPANNEIYLNDFENLIAGTISQGQNGDYSLPNNGLEILCGKHVQVKYNIAALNLEGFNAKLAYRQGDNALFPTHYTAPAGNLFDENNASGDEENDFYVDNETVYTFTYEHHNEDSPFPVVPVELNPNEVTNSENIPLFEDRNQCCPKVRSNEGNPNGHLDLVLVKRLQIKDLEDDLSGMMDGGNSQIITDFVQNPLNSSAQVRMNLLPLAPYLTDQVLIAALKRTPELNPWHLCEILISCSPLSSKTWVEVENNTTMSDYLYQLLVEYQNGTNGRWTKEMEIKRLAKAKALSERAYTYWALNDSTEEYHMQPYRDMMTGDEINRSIQLRFPLLLKEKKYSEALSLLEDYEDNGEDQWPTVAELICELDSIKFSSVDKEAKLTQLEGFANRETEAGRTAWSYLELFDRGALEQKLMLPTPGTKSKKLRTDKRALLSDVYPNPGNDYIYITFVLPEERQNATVVVYDMGGRQVYVSDITKVHGILEMNTSALVTGQYIYEINLEGKSVSNGKFVIQH
jgi:hypothetical protein